MDLELTVKDVLSIGVDNTGDKAASLDISDIEVFRNQTEPEKIIVCLKLHPEGFPGSIYLDIDPEGLLKCARDFLAREGTETGRATVDCWAALRNRPCEGEAEDASNT